MISTAFFRVFSVVFTCIFLSCFSVHVSAAKEAKAPAVSANKISINSANAEMLAEVLSGVGLKKAQAIVAYRKANGKFTRLDDLVLVKGIGAETLKKNKAKLTL